MRAADGDIRPELSGRREQRQRQKVRCHRHSRAASVSSVNDRTAIHYISERSRVLQQDSKERRPIGLLRLVTDDHFDSERISARFYDRDCLRVAVLGHKEGVPAFVPFGRMAKVHRLGGRGRFVQK